MRRNSTHWTRQLPNQLGTTRASEEICRCSSARGIYYKLGYEMFTIVGSSATRYQMFMDITNVAFLGESLVTPQGNTVTLKLTGTFTTPHGGFIFLYYDPGP